MCVDGSKSCSWHGASCSAVGSAPGSIVMINNPLLVRALRLGSLLESLPEEGGLLGVVLEVVECSYKGTRERSLRQALLECC